VITPGDLGDTRTRSAYRKSGPCIVSKIREVGTVTDRTLRGLVGMPFDRAREAGLGLCKEMSDSQLKQFWSVPLSYVRRMRYLLGIEKDRQGTIYLRDGHPDQWPPVFRKDDQPGHADRYAATKPGTGAICPQAAAWDTKSAEIATSMSIAQERDALKGFTLSFSGIFHAGDLKSRIEAVKALLSSSPDSKYAIAVTLREIGNCIKSEYDKAEALSGRDLPISDAEADESLQ
jgi:hypothetical protein